MTNVSKASESETDINHAKKATSVRTSAKVSPIPKAPSKQSIKESKGDPRPLKVFLEPRMGTVEPTRVLKEGIFGNSRALDTVSMLHEPSAFTDGKKSSFSTPRLQHKEMKVNEEVPVKSK